MKINTCYHLGPFILIVVNSAIFYLDYGLYYILFIHRLKSDTLL